MKTIVWMGWTFLVSIAAWAGCPDFSGNYVAKDMMGRPITMRVAQKGCASMDIDTDYDHRMLITRNLIFDGVQRVVFSSSEMTTYESSLIDEQGISYESMDDYIRLKAKYLSHGKIFFDGEGHLVEKISYEREDGTPLTESVMVYSRQ